MQCKRRFAKVEKRLDEKKKKETEERKRKSLSQQEDQGGDPSWEDNDENPSELNGESDVDDQVSEDEDDEPKEIEEESASDDDDANSERDKEPWNANRRVKLVIATVTTLKPGTECVNLAAIVLSAFRG